MKRMILAGLAAATLALTACGGGGYGGGYGGYDDDWDMNHESPYNSRTYCGTGTYKPLSGNRYACYRNGRAVSTLTRPKPIAPPKRKTTSNSNSWNSNNKQSAKQKSGSSWGSKSSSSSKSSSRK